MKRIIAFLAVLWLAAPLAAQATKAEDIVAPYVDEMTFIVGRVDVSRVPMEEVARRVQQFTGEGPGGNFEEAKRVHAEFQRLGGKEVFFLLNIAEGPPAVLAIVPLGAQADGNALTALLTDKSQLEVQRKGDVLLVGAKEAVESALARKPAAAPGLGKALAAVSGASTQVALLPPRPFFRAQEELVANLPRHLGGGPITTVTKGFQWAAVGVDIAPKLQLKVVVQGGDPTAAQKLLEVIEAFLQHIAAEGAAAAPMLAKVLPTLTPKLEGDRLVLALEDKALQDVLRPAVVQTRQAAARQQSMNNLKQMALALHNYHDVHKAFPPQASLAGDKKLLSWRVHILPFLEQDNLYRQFKLDEPWDSEHNKKLIKLMPPTYQSPLAKNVAAGKTVYLAPVGKDTIFGGPMGLHIGKITDGTSNTIMLVEADPAKAVIWTQPDDLKVTAEDSTAGLLPKDAKGFIAAYADGSVRFISSQVDPKVLWALFTANGGEVIPEKIEKE